MTSPFDRFMSKVEKRCSELGISYRKVKLNQCPQCGYDPTENLKAAQKIQDTPSK